MRGFVVVSSADCVQVGNSPSGSRLVVFVGHRSCFASECPAERRPATGGLVSLVGGWLGGELVERLGIAVHPGANVDAPNSLVLRFGNGRWALKLSG
jgi:hypothetical protein